MVKTNNKKSIWEPQFIGEINRDICLDCNRFNEIGGRNTFKLRTVDNSNNSGHQVMTIANPEQCADCDACTSIY
ncbi:MAG: hypothetical protein AAFR77_01855 [Cyanobacteria bacterium J06631_2]